MVECVVCGAPALPSVEHGGYRLFACTRAACRHVFVSPAPGEEELRAVYALEEDHLANAHSWVIAEDYKRAPEVVRAWYRRTRVRHLMAKGCLPSLQTAVLDVGCSTGIFLRVLKDAGYRRLHGMDLSELHCRFCRDTHGIPCDLSLEAVPDAAFDLVTGYAVIEHTRDPMQFLAQLARKLKPGGRLVLLTPNYRSFYRSLAGRHWIWLIPPFHLQYFGPESLTQALTRSGFDVVHAQTDYTATYVYLLAHHATNIMGRPMPSTRRSGRGLVLKAVNLVEAATRVALYPLAAIARATGRHNELIYVARKSGMAMPAASGVPDAVHR